MEMDSLGCRTFALQFLMNANKIDKKKQDQCGYPGVLQKCV